MFNLYKIMFMMTLALGTLMAISSNSWLGMWMGLEINLLSMIPLMNNNKNLFSSEASLKYFITQALASAILLFSIIILMSQSNLMNNVINDPTLIMIMNSTLLTKMGAAPFHFWFPEVMEGLSWLNSLTLLTWQKIAPMVLLMYNAKLITFLSIIIIFCMMVSGVIGLNQTSLRKILAYSSINHIGWMIASMIFIQSIWTYYFSIYALINANIILVFKYFNTFYIKQLFTLMSYNNTLKLFFMLNFFSLGGLPPFLGFLPKWLTIQNMVQNNQLTLSFIMIVMTLITLYFYMRLTFSSILLNTTQMTTDFMQLKTLNTQILVFNFIMITALIYCTLMFNWL
uniref:NADH dehydrogenase subunit 2 n=1 Tax=Dicerca corrugata TaxID=1857262 RepID=UPI002008ED57|nr:NADH dehydrogenase subunit 2 [Dicerca corrugata]UPI13484.1 NADH dehydrogenase subunit 2 [Dicerca corrugata]